MQEFNDVEKFRIIIEELDFCRHLLTQKSDIPARISIILLDNIADILMYRKCRDQFVADEELSNVFRPKTKFEERENILRHFNSKVLTLKRLKFINQFSVDVLTVAHSYRNAVYHRDSHNPRTINELSRILFKVVCNLFTNFYNNGSSSHFSKQYDWMKKYLSKPDSVDFHNDSQGIKKRFLKGVTITLPRAKKAFVADINFRFEAIDKLRQEIGLNDVMLNVAFLRLEFDHQFPYESLSEDLREIHYQITENKKPSKGIYVKIKRRFERRYKRKFRNFLKTRPHIMPSTELNKLRNSTVLKNSNSLDFLLKNYQNIDSRLSQFEFLLNKAEEEFDLEVQREIDRRRGK